MSIIEVESLTKTFRSRERSAGLLGSLHSFVTPRYREREAVKHISFAIESGEVVAFIGPNGRRQIDHDQGANRRPIPFLR